MNHRNHPLSLTFAAGFVAAVAFLTGCASTLDQAGLEQRTGQAIGRSAGQFTITDRDRKSVV